MIEHIVLKNVSDIFEIPIDDITSKCREDRLIKARVAYFVLMKTYTKCNLTEISSHINRHYSVMCWYKKRYPELMQNYHFKYLMNTCDWRTKRKVRRLKQLLDI